ncbi:FtsX-like permease family protein [Actinoallomurus iriomotensis]|uniref:ABC3 transporter permease C-terminal domain-containing protein n=1 Tax=Actinoallomurus iriomotensis TaxID=478107 RepID=A0A9W6SET5_9ACTN|nr:FtsX-like permease family protein [Actinoallomurus iriomotensis]GLY92264.1 hypothetical protein Airi02_101920 [Actinoallomurus iriomotensis]
MRGRLVLGTIRANLGSYLASAVVMTAGTALLTGFASLLETGLTTAARSDDILVMLPAILGGWTVAIVVFGVISTVALTVQHREREIALLRSIAATPRQIRQNIVLETTVTAVPAVAAGVLPGIGIGAFILQRLIDAGLVHTPVQLHAGWLCVVIGAATSLLAAISAALIISRRAASIPPVRALAESTPTGSRSLTRVRAVAGVMLLVIGLSMSAATLAMANGPLLSSTAGPAGVAVAVGLALLSPVAVEVVGRFTNAPLGAAGRLATRNIHARAKYTATVAAPLILLVGIAAGTLYMQSTEDSVHHGASGTGDTAERLASVNYLVVAMIIGFSAIMVVNTLIAATRRRKREFGLLRLTVATRRQVLTVVCLEAAVIAGLAAVLGTIAAAATTVPYCLVKIGSPMAAGPAWVYIAIVGGAFLLAMVATIPTAMGAMRSRAVDALTAT